MGTRLVELYIDCTFRGIFIPPFSNIVYCIFTCVINKHLMHFLEAQCISAFPVTRRRRAAKVKLSSTLHVYCSCCMPEQAGSTMIQCSTCKEWFHVGVCVDVPSQAFDSATKWFCNKCNY